MNLGTFIILVILLSLIGAIVASMVRKKKKGTSSCGCGCSGCALSGSCHKKS